MIECVIDSRNCYEHLVRPAHSQQQVLEAANKHEKDTARG